MIIKFKCSISHLADRIIQPTLWRNIQIHWNETIDLSGPDWLENEGPIVLLKSGTQLAICPFEARNSKSYEFTAQSQVCLILPIIDRIREKFKELNKTLYSISYSTPN